MMGANLVVISHVGTYGQKKPYAPNPGYEQNLDCIVAMAAKAHLWVVIALRSAPGRHFEQGDADSDPRNEPI